MGYAPMRSYDNDDDDDESVGVLDDVDPKITGHANMSSMQRIFRKSNIVFAIRAVLLLSCITSFVMEVNPPDGIRRKETDSRWCTEPTDHFTQLMSFHLISKIEEGEVRYVSTYFGVSKSSGGARSIFNGKEFSSQCTAPPSTNLPDVTKVLILLDEMSRGGGTWPCVALGDIRHYFHQLPMNFGITKFFCLMIKKTFYRWLSLPMGFSWSPFIAQSISIGLVLKAMEISGYDISNYNGLPSPPSCIILRDKTGRIEVLSFVWYDNILIACVDPTKAPVLSHNFRVICEADSNARIQLKEWRFFGPKNFSRPADIVLNADPTLHDTKLPGPKYLGLEFCRWRVNRGDDPTLHWRIEEKRIRKWYDLSKKIDTTMTYRLVAKMCGAILWRQHISMAPLCRVVDVISIVRKCGSVCRRRADWDREVMWSDAEQDALRRRLAVAYTSEWFKRENPTLRSSCVIAASDSSKRRWGICIWSPDHQLDYIEGKNWSHDMIKAGIFVKELTAAVMTIERITSQYSHCHIKLLVDNTAAAAVLRKLASSTDIGNELASRVDKALTSSHCSLEVIHICSQQNPADDPSRNRPLDVGRVAMMWQVVEAAEVGGYVPVLPRPVPTQLSGLRHAENSEHDEYDSEDDPHEEWSCLGNDKP